MSSENKKQLGKGHRAPEGDKIQGAVTKKEKLSGQEIARRFAEFVKNAIDPEETKECVGVDVADLLDPKDERLASSMSELFEGLAERLQDD